MMLPGMPDNRGFGRLKFDAPECLPLTYSVEDLAQGFPHLKTSGPTWEPGILRPIDLLAQRAGVITAVFGGGALRAGLASAAAAVAAVGGFLIPSPLADDAPGPQSVAASDLSGPGVSDTDDVTAALTLSSQVVSASGGVFAQTSAPQEQKVEATSPLQATKDEGRAQVEQIRETDEVGTALGSGGALTRDTFDRSTSTIFERQS